MKKEVYFISVGAPLLIIGLYISLRGIVLHKGVGELLVSFGGILGGILIGLSPSLLLRGHRSEDIIYYGMGSGLPALGAIIVLAARPPLLSWVGGIIAALPVMLFELVVGPKPVAAKPLPKSEVLVCPRCKAKIPGDSVFCPECGRKV